MQGINHQTVALLGAALVAAALAGCTPDANSAGAAAKASSAGAKRDSYELVTVERPESMKAYTERLRVEYDTCVGFAEIRRLPVKPFPAIPADALKSRSTYLSDGRSFSYVEEEWGVDNEDVVPEKGCAARYGSWTRKTITRDGFQYILGEAGPGEEPSPPVPAPVLPFDADKAAAYTVPQKKKGIALKCADASSPVIASGLASDACIIDPDVAKIATADGEPIQVNLRNLSADAMQGGVTVFEAVSLKTGVKVDPTHFSTGGKK